MEKKLSGVSYLFMCLRRLLFSVLNGESRESRACRACIWRVLRMFLVRFVKLKALTTLQRIKTSDLTQFSRSN